MSYSTINTKLEGEVAILTISRPESLNALNSILFKELNDYLDSVSKNSEVKVLIITGDGKAFVAGADIAEMQNMTKEEAIQFSKIGQDTFSRLENLDIPVIAAVNGYALGGGCELALACDFRISNNYGKFGLPEVSLGLIPGYGGTQRLSRLSGLGNTLFLQLTGQMIDATEALRMGIVQKVTEANELMDETFKIAKKITQHGPNAIKTLKRVVRNGYQTDLNKAFDLESNEFSKLFESDGPEGMTAFLEKRKPNWK
ncbi:MAG: enoyl-CoA hydratase/isomerase family protein [Bacteroidales bacterium]|nr:enoyl-CoA hydratase/isomerase family protein [Bacteroidales bacterium]